MSSTNETAEKVLHEAEHVAIYWREIAEQGWPLEWEIACKLRDEIHALRAALLVGDANARRLESERAAMQVGIRMEAERHAEALEALAEELDISEDRDGPMFFPMVMQRVIELKSRAALKCKQ